MILNDRGILLEAEETTKIRLNYKVSVGPI